jgi:CCR4-NOT transcriptional regulation complex NOT5 subunit
MSKINIAIPEPSEVYNKDTQRQIIQAVDTLKTQLNTSFQEELKQEVERFTWFNG